MAKGLLEGALGGEEEKIDPTVGGTEPIVAAVAANLASQNPDVAAKTAAMFEEQTELLKSQRKNIEAEYEVFESEAAPRLLALRLRTAFQVFISLVATVIGLGFAMLIRDALTSHRVIVDPFHAPPAMATRGIDGTVVASGLLDELTRLQDATRSSAQNSTNPTAGPATKLAQTGFMRLPPAQGALRARCPHRRGAHPDPEWRPCPHRARQRRARQNL